MKVDKKHPEYEVFKNFRLTNEERPYFGLDKINEQWEEIEIKEGTTVFYLGDVIKKIITWSNLKRYEYSEFDTELKTRERQFVLPKTRKGKEKKITPTNLLSFQPSGCVVNIGLKTQYFKSYVSASNYVNNLRLPITDDEGLVTIPDLKEWIKRYIKTCPADYWEKVEKLRTTPRQTIKFKAGDVFRFEIDRENYGFGIIIGKLRELEKLGIFGENHPMHDVMTMPIFIRLYKMQTKNKNLSLDEITKYELLPTEVMSDNDIIWGTHEIVGSKVLEENDINFPIQFGCTIDVTKKRIFRFAWGVGMKIIEDNDSIPNDLKNNKYLKHSVSLSLPIYKLRRVLEGQSEFNIYDDLLHPENKKIKDKVFELLTLPLGIDMDTFNRENNGMTRSEYIQFLNKKLL